MSTSDDDLFGRPTRGSFPKFEELEGRLVLLKPSRVEYGLKGKFGEQDRVTTDVVILDGDDAPEEISDMYVSQKGLVGMLAKCLKPGAKHPFILGRVEKRPTKEWAAKAEAAGDGDPVAGINALIEDFYRKKGKGEEPQWFWNLADFTDEDAVLARNYIRSTDQFATAS